MRSRRAPTARPGNGQPSLATRFRVEELDPKPALIRKRPHPKGNFDRAPIERICDAVRDWGGSDNKSTVHRRLHGARAILQYLTRFEGRTWQERWEASGLDDGTRHINDLLDEPGVVLGCSPKGYPITSGLRAMMALRLFKPSLQAFRQQKPFKYAEYFREVQDDPKLDEFFAAVDRAPYARMHRNGAKFDVCCAMTTQGICFADLTPEALIYYATQCRIHNVVPQHGGDSTRFAGLLAWEILNEMGHFPAGTPPTMRGHLYRGQRSPAELVDRYAIRNQSVRQLLIDYTDRRRGETDYGTLEGLVENLARVFWLNVEAVAPDQSDLNLSEQVYNAWKARARLKKNGEPLLDFEGRLLVVRAFYMDIQSWALEEPERWAVWAVPCPIPTNDLKGFGVRRRKTKQRVDERTKARQPLLPHLIRHVENRYHETRDLLQVASQVELGEEFTHKDVIYRRTDTKHDRLVSGDEFTATIRVERLADGEIRPLSQEEESSFWDWCFVEVLRHSGIRVEELVELTHTSIRQYQRPNGEVVPLLVIAPSKTMQERVVPMSPELFHVCAAMIRRVSRSGSVPLVSRYDHHEKVWTTPLPFLFQRVTGAIRRVIGTATVTLRLKRACQQVALSRPEFEKIEITAHDFRRLFATELVNNGLPIHIGAALLGHLDIQTTRGYVAVFEDDVIRHYQQWLANRRTERPSTEYRPVTDAEWSEFEAHFDKRKVELGSCGRPYGTPCKHEHACVRCAMLHVNVNMIPKLDEIEEDLIKRRTRAADEGWLGEIEGLELTLRFLRDKREEALRFNGDARTDLGLPTLPKLER
jgi:site-specific recombinase XerD